ncbi:hypothetical protein [Lysobacter solisilvae (ex Woo and Kim 2020)]|uniref:Uncharacterized protein n=1 Tax=Agrilutibacter terrestris TaxID=2865112 RepID=A0A7H0G046_9GAMM|nr:hypothetical protein [Lysobacter terrestris]QNP41662.1 hypothetical protein H8B22_05500 [Lysobacter terrestris]
MTAKHTLLFVALAATLFAATPAFAQDVPPDATETDAGVPKDRLVDEYADPLFAGDEVAAGDAITALRTGGGLTVVSTVTRQATNPDGTPATNPDGTPKMETVTVETVVANANGPMGWGEVDHSLGLAQALVEGGQAGTFDEALLGAAVTTTVTNPDGTTTTTTTYEGGILEMRADGMGWGQIAKELGFKSLGEVKSGRYADAEAGTTTVAADAKGKGAAKVASESRGKSAEHKPERAAKAERVTGKPEKVERIAKVERPAKIDRPERPSKPDRVGRP